MTNPDTNTLNGALEQLGITMADNLNTMGVSDADPSDGLTTLAGKILDIGPTPPTPTPASLDLSLTAGKQILSYADRASGNEYATLSALVLDENDDPLPGVSVSIYKDNVLWYTAETGAGGTISKTYDSEGVGDVSFHAVCGSFVTETYTVEDCWKYFTESSASISNFQLPSGAFKLTCTAVKTGDYNGVIHLWQTSNTTVGFGFLIPSDYKYDLGYYNGSTWNRQQLGTSSSGQSVNLTLTYDNGVFTLSDGTNSVTLNKTCSNPLSKFEIEHKTGLSFSNVKIKPL